MSMVGNSMTGGGAPPPAANAAPPAQIAPPAAQAATTQRMALPLDTQKSPGFAGLAIASFLTPSGEFPEMDSAGRAPLGVRRLGGDKFMWRNTPLRRRLN